MYNIVDNRLVGQLVPHRGALRESYSTDYLFLLSILSCTTNTAAGPLCRRV